MYILVVYIYETIFTTFKYDKSINSIFVFIFLDITHY